MTIRFIQVGIGGWGSGWLRTLIESNLGVELVAYVDSKSEDLQHAQTIHTLPAERCFTRLEDALDTVEADAVLIVTDLPTHVPLALLALKYGKHVLMEKPFAQTLLEARQVVSEAEQQSRVLMISQTYRFSPQAQVAAELVRTTPLGAVGTINIDFRRDLSHETRNHRIWQPLLANLTVHHFDLMRMVLAQEPRQVLCQTWNPPWSKYSDPASAVATVSFPGGTVANYRGSAVSTGPTTLWSDEWHMECAGGEIIWTSPGPDGQSIPAAVTIRPFGQEPYPAELPELPYTERTGVLEAFLRAIQTGEEPECSGRDNLGTLALVMAAVESANKGQSISLDVSH